VQPKYEDAQSFSNGFAAVKDKGKWGYVDKTGTVVIDPKYTRVQAFTEERGAIDLQPSN
jgi:hypothetical protein